MAYTQENLSNISNFKPPRRKKDRFGVKPKKRKDKDRPGRRAGVATGIATGLFFGLTPAVRAIQKTFGKG